MAADKVCCGWGRGGGWRRRGHGRQGGLICGWEAQSRRSAGGWAEKRGSDLAQAGQSEGTRYAPVYHALKGGHAGPFWSAWPPRRQPRNPPPLNFYAIGRKLFNIYPPIDVCFLRERLQETFFYASRSSWGKDHKQSLLCQLAFYCDVLIWHCGLEEPSVDTGGGI